MHLTFGKAHGNGAAAVRLCLKRYPERRLQTQALSTPLIITSRRPVLLTHLWQTAKDEEVHEQLM
jgi:hypothetical protein